MLWELFICICVVCTILAVISWLVSPPSFPLNNKHILITGGSSGIGKAIAKEAVRNGAVISIAARNILRSGGEHVDHLRNYYRELEYELILPQDKLNTAKEEIEKIAGNNFKPVCCISVDVAGDYDAVQKAVVQAEDKHGPVEILINCAGLAVSGTFEDLSIEDFKKMMNLNYLGSVQMTKAVVTRMKERGSGRIVLLSSQAGQLGLFGYTAYSASKFALRGLAESLQMELRPHNIYVTVSFPPDTETPGFEVEELSKPEETRLISDTSGVFKPEFVAKKILQDTTRGTFYSYIGIDGWLLANVTCGMSPVHSVLEAIQQILTMSIFRLISLFYLVHFGRIVKNCKLKNDKLMKEKVD